MECVDFQSPIAWDAPLNRGLLRWWLCLPNQNRGNMWRDLSRRMDATVIGATVAGVRSRPGGWGCWEFDGTNDTLQSAGTIDLSSVSTITLAFWLNWTAFATGNDLAFEWSDNANSNTGAFYVNPNVDASNVLILINTGGGGTFSGVQFPVPTASTWLHWVVCMDRGAGAQQIPAVYINGKAQSLTNPYTDPASGNFGNYQLNFMARNNTNLFGQGMMDDVRLYNRVLRASEAVELYRASKAGYKNELRWLREMRNSEQASVLTSPAYYRRRRSA